MRNSDKSNEELMSPDQHETLKQTLLCLLDDPELQQKLVALLRRSGLTASRGISVPQRWIA